MLARLLTAGTVCLAVAFAAGAGVGLWMVPAIPYARFRLLRNAVAKCSLALLGGLMSAGIVVVVALIIVVAAGTSGGVWEEGESVTGRERGPGMSRQPAYGIGAAIVGLGGLLVGIMLGALLYINLGPFLRRLAFAIAWRAERTRPFVALFHQHGRSMRLRRDGALALSVALERMAPEARRDHRRALREGLRDDLLWADALDTRLVPPRDRDIAGIEAALDREDTDTDATAIAALDTVVRPQQDKPLPTRSVGDLVRRGFVLDRGREYLASEGALYRLQDDFASALPRLAADPACRKALAARLAGCLSRNREDRYVVSQSLKLLAMLGAEAVAHADLVAEVGAGGRLPDPTIGYFRTRLAAERDLTKFPVRVPADSRLLRDEELVERLRALNMAFGKKMMLVIIVVLVLHIGAFALFIDRLDRAGWGGTFILGMAALWIATTAAASMRGNRGMKRAQQAFRIEHGLSEQEFAPINDQAMGKNSGA